MFGIAIQACVLLIIALCFYELHQEIKITSAYWDAATAQRDLAQAQLSDYLATHPAAE